MPKREEPIQNANQETENATMSPEHSNETQEMINSIDENIRISEDFSAGLGLVAREKILTDPAALEEIYAPKEIKKNIEGRYDRFMFESAGDGLLVRNALKRIMTLGWAGSKHALDGGGYLLDKRKLRQGVESRQHELE